MADVRLLAFAGSARKGSWNRKLLDVGVSGARDAGATVKVVEMGDYPMPLMDEDLEKAEGVPAKAQEFKALMKEHHGFLIACPEYNSSLTPLLKNTIDWASRKEGDEAPLECFTGKTCGLLSASPGALGGLRGLVHVRAILSNINVLVIPQQFALGKANEAFNDDGTLKDAKSQSFATTVGKRLAEVTQALQA